MKHIMMGFKWVINGVLFAICMGVLLVAIIVIQALCGTVVVFGVVIALVLFALGVADSYDGGGI